MQANHRQIPLSPCDTPFVLHTVSRDDCLPCPVSHRIFPCPECHWASTRQPRNWTGQIKKPNDMDRFTACSHIPNSPQNSVKLSFPSKEPPPMVPLTSAESTYILCPVYIALFTQSGKVGDSRPAPKSKPPRPERMHQWRWLSGSPHLGPMNLL